jgi:hypothetical protein
MACTIPRFVKGWWFSPIFSSNKTDSNDITSAKVKARVKDAAYKVMSFFLAMW